MVGWQAAAMHLGRHAGLRDVHGHRKFPDQAYIQAHNAQGVVDGDNSMISVAGSKLVSQKLAANTPKLPPLTVEPLSTHTRY